METGEAHEPITVRCPKCRTHVFLPADSCTRCGKALPPPPRAAPEPPAPAAPPAPAQRPRAPRRPIVRLVAVVALAAMVAAWALFTPSQDVEGAEVRRASVEEPSPTRAAPVTPSTSPPTRSADVGGQTSVAATPPSAPPPDPIVLGAASPVSPREGERFAPGEIRLEWTSAQASDGSRPRMRALVDGVPVSSCAWEFGRTSCTVTVDIPGAHVWEVEAAGPAGTYTRSDRGSFTIEKRVWTVHVPEPPDPVLPERRSAIRRAVEAGIASWDGRGLRVTIVDQPTPGAIEVRYHASAVSNSFHGSDDIEIVLGDRLCQGAWTPYDAASITAMAAHGMGHVTGHAHVEDPASVMSPALMVRYAEHCLHINGTDDLPPEGGWYFRWTFNETTELRVKLSETSGRPARACTGATYQTRTCVPPATAFDQILTVPAGHELHVQCEHSGLTCRLHYWIAKWDPAQRRLPY